MRRYGTIQSATWDAPKKTYVLQPAERTRMPATSVARPLGFRRDGEGHLVAANMAAVSEIEAE